MNSFERRARQHGHKMIAGIDEAGRGPLAGPVVAAAVILPADYENTDIRDSKQLSAKKRETLYDIIKRDALSIGLGVVEVPVIDAINILRASLVAMREARRIFIASITGTSTTPRPTDRASRLIMS